MSPATALLVWRIAITAMIIAACAAIGWHVALCP
jgi:hypothetical protein